MNVETAVDPGSEIAGSRGDEIAGSRGDEIAMLRAMVRHAETVVALLDADGRIVSTSGAVERLLGHDQHRLTGRSLLDLVAPVDHQTIQRLLRAPVAGSPTGEPCRIAVHLLHADDPDPVPYELAIVDLRHDPAVRGLVITGHDVSERSATEAGLRDSLSLLSATLESTVDGIVVVDLDGRVTGLNARFLDMWQVTHDVPSLVSNTDANRLIVREMSRAIGDPDHFLAKLAEIDADSHCNSFDILTLTDGRLYERYSTPQQVDGIIVGRVWSFHDITRQKQLEHELVRQAFHDSLTGLANQALFRDRVSHAMTRMLRDGGEVAVIYFDLDDFKRVNDSLGHRAGDQLLIACAERLDRCVRDTDTTARLGGDEFAVLVESPDVRRDAVDIADRIMAAFEGPVSLGGHEVVASASVGIAFSDPELDAEQLVRNADLAMYAVKASGKSGRQVFSSSMRTAAVARVEMEADLHAALDREEFWVAYQPIVQIDTLEVAGMEALVRWRHPRWGEAGPAVFIRSADQIGVIDDISEFVLADVGARVQDWNAGRVADHVEVSVNLSARQVMSGVATSQVDSAIRSWGIDPAKLVIEVTESAMLQDTRAAAQTLSELKSLGVRVALDDFGTGCSSLTHLQQFPIDIVKIDGSFMTPDGHDESLVRALVSLCRDLGLVAVAEGVETEEQFAFLRDVGCQYGQGHYFAAPAAPTARLPLIGNRQAHESADRVGSTVGR